MNASCPVPATNKLLCKSSCLLAAQNLQEMFNNSTLCGAMDINNNRATALAQYQATCSALPEDLPPAINPPNCIYAVKSEVAQCGFPLLNDSNAYCTSPAGVGRMTKDFCCNCTGTFSLADVKTKNLSVIYGMVFNLNGFVQKHPGGDFIVRNMIGYDGTSYLMTSPHKGTDKILENIHDYMLGVPDDGVVIPAAVVRTANVSNVSNVTTIMSKNECGYNAKPGLLIAILLFLISFHQ
jgi:hypothetical protein